MQLKLTCKRKGENHESRKVVCFEQCWDICAVRAPKKCRITNWQRSNTWGSMCALLVHLLLLLMSFLCWLKLQTVRPVHCQVAVSKCLYLVVSFQVVRYFLKHTTVSNKSRWLRHYRKTITKIKKCWLFCKALFLAFLSDLVLPENLLLPKVPVIKYVIFLTLNSDFCNVHYDWHFGS